MTKPIALVAGYQVRHPMGGHVLSQLRGCRSRFQPVRPVGQSGVVLCGMR
jgi:hypothetical protein